jgi:Protein of unknown function (DUF3443)
VALPVMRVLRFLAGITLCLSVLACGGGGKSGFASGGSGGATPAASNVTSVIVDAGPANNSVNTLYTSVTVCVPGGTNCQTIDHIQVDTASFGLRILAPALNIALALQTAANGNSLVECAVFADGYTWGPVALADVKMSGELAGSVPIQIIGDSRFTAVPSDCSATGPTEEDTVEIFGANGILGIGVFMQDCGPECAATADPEFYYSCTAAQCQPTTVPLANQVPNPISFFATDNNGSIIDLPSVASPGALTLTGSLIFGVDTQSNNASGSETVLTVDPNFGYLTAIFNGQTLNQSFIDSGSSGTFFDDSSIAPCTDMNLTSFYCPAATENLTAMLKGANGATATVNFSVGNALTLSTDNPTFSVLPALAGTNPLANSFDFGLPFFYGRRVATVLESSTTSAGTGPYIAF